jgi:hypothetical protein
VAALITAALAATALTALPTLSIGALPGLPTLTSSGTVDKAVTNVAPSAPAPAPSPPKAAAVLKKRAPVTHRTVAPRAAAPRAADPSTTPPLHGTNPHGQGTVAVVDTNPDPKRPYSGDTTGKTDNEDIVVGRSRGEQSSDGSYHGHITVAALFGNELIGVDSKPGQTNHGPLDALQTSLLDAICSGSGGQLCLSLLTADSSTTTTGSTNHFSVAHAKLGGDSGIEAGAAESNGNISSDGTCQSSHGDSTVADAKAGGNAVASVSKSSTDSKACQGQAPTQTDSSSVIGLGGQGVPIPAPGCADGTPDTVTGIPTLLPLICNGDDANAGQGSDPYGVRDALDAFVLATGTTAAAKATTAGSESTATAPAANTSGSESPPQCSDGVDNDGDGLIDAADPGCHSDGNANNPASYVPSDNDESNGTTGSSTSPSKSNGNNNGAGVKGSNGSGNNGKPQCSDGIDNDGDNLVDEADPGCHTDGNAHNPSSYNPNDDSEANGAVPASSSGLPFTGTDVLTVALIGALLLAAGIALRTRLPRRRLQA